MGTLARIAAGTAGDAVARIADVQLKERRPLILVPRETPLNLIHLRNMTTLTQAGAVIAPAAPAFYTRPDSLDTLVDTFVARILQLAGLASLEAPYRWNR
jgi:4-hydroxy-3-polyprenylbenzoate decarboxylase